MNTYLVGIDLAKTVFQLQAVDKKGGILSRHRVSRAMLLKTVEKLNPRIIAMEACGSAHYWARQFKKKGIEVQLIPAQYVKPFVKTNKNDSADCEAICLAAKRPDLKFVPVKSIWHHDLQGLHRIRQQLVYRRVGWGNMIRGLLSEYGVIAPKGVSKFKEKMKDLISKDSLEGDLSLSMKESLEKLFSGFEELEKEIKYYTDKIEEFAKNDESCKRLVQLKGVGPLSATAIICSLVNPGNFKNGRAASAWLGLVPRHVASGNKTTLLGIGKRGDKYCRTLLIHGARASLISAHKRKDLLSQWATKLIEKKGLNKAAVALANKNTRLIWAMMKKGNAFKIAA